MSRYAEVRNDRHYTYADYCRFPENERWELIDGVAYSMAPAPSEAHQNLAGEIFRQASSALRGKRCRAYIAPLDVRFDKSETTDTVVQPDVMVFCDRSKLDARGAIGAPDWVVEVISPSTAGKDQIKKRHLYESAGVRELWLVHPVDRIVTVLRRGEDERFRSDIPQELIGKTEVQAIPGLTIDWDLWEPLNDPE